ncbi:MAG TPA: TRAP transporter TatT component family protein [Polyangiaceae bacterium]|nr:TRAP transporter TatT component family protein [Polyangiaceae bacterium]
MSVLLSGAAAFGLSACAREYVMIQTGVFPEPMIYEDSLKWTREASDAIQTMHDYESAKDAAYGNMGMLEGLHKLVPDNEDGLLLLVRSWSGISFAFMDDEREEAIEKKDEALEKYHEARARAGFKRARFYGNELIELQAKGFKEAQKNADTLRAYLKENFDDKKYAEELLWTAFSIVGRINFDMDNPETVAELWIGVELLEHVTRLDPTIEYGTAYTMLGAARAGLQEYDLAKQDFDAGEKIAGGRLLTNQVTMAQRYYCPKRDKKNYFAMLHAVLDAKDPLPEQRLSNTIAKRRAQRYLNNKIWQQDCAFEG